MTLYDTISDTIGFFNKGQNRAINKATMHKK